MNYEVEIAELKKQYNEKIENFNKNKRPSNYRDANGKDENSIDVWFLNEINKLKAKYKKI